MTDADEIQIPIQIPDPAIPCDLTCFRIRSFWVQCPGCNRMHRAENLPDDLGLFRLWCPEKGGWAADDTGGKPVELSVLLYQGNPQVGNSATWVAIGEI